MPNDLYVDPLAQIMGAGGFNWPKIEPATPEAAAAEELVRANGDQVIEAFVAEYRGGSWQELVERLERKHGIVLARIKK